MEVTIEKSALVPVESLINSPILQQCLLVLRTAAEFQNLSYRVTKTGNNLEVLVVYREGILGIFGPPVDPITLTLDPKGRCLVTILFKPVQRVSIVNSESGQIEIASLLAVLRMISGKGYLFCPGLPEKFLARKACGKIVVLYKVPFKRYQSIQCPVYYHAPAVEQTNKSLCALCPKCIRAAKWIQAMPVFASNSSEILPQPDQRNLTQSIGTSSTQADTSTNVRSSLSRILGLASFHTNSVTSPPVEPGILKSILSSGQPMSSVDVNGNSQAMHTLMGSKKPADQSLAIRDDETTLIGDKILALRTFLRNILHDKDLELSDVDEKIGDAQISSHTIDRTWNNQLEKGKRSQKNSCRQCKKPFSTPASLLNHLQRHEALAGNWQKKYREQKMHKKSFPIFHRRILQGIKAREPLFKHIKKESSLSETSIKLFLKYLDDVVTSKNDSKSFKKKSHGLLEEKAVKSETLEKQNDLQAQQIVTFDKLEDVTSRIRCGVKRSGSGLSPMQTLLEAAAIAEVSQDDVSSSTVSSSSSMDKGKQHEPVVVSTTSQSPTFSSELSDDSFPPKKQRKSTRIASKRARKNKKDVSSYSEAKLADNTSAISSHDPSLLTNLNLLSTVSLETSMRHRQMQTQATVSSSIPLSVVSPDMKTNTAAFPITLSPALSVSGLNGSRNIQPTSESLSISPMNRHNTSGGNVKISRSQSLAPLVNTNLHSSPVLPPLPPLVYAGMQGMSTISHYSPQRKDSSAPQNLSSTVKSPANVDSIQPSTSSSTVTSSESSTSNNHLSDTSCGAIDLSKPKHPLKHNIPEAAEKKVDSAVLSGLPYISQLVTGNNLSEILQHLVTIGKSSTITCGSFQELQPINAASNSKETDSNLQARMFASARNYKIDNKGVKNSPQVQAVIASSSRNPPPGKGVKVGAVAQAEEVQCGYKWSGSGGLVKERTQMVRELVSADVMANFLSKTPLVVPASQLIISPFNSHSQQTGPQPALVSVSGRSTQSKSHNQHVPDAALNLITNKPNETIALKKGLAAKLHKSTSGKLLPSSPPIGDQVASTCTSSSERSILKSSLINTAPVQTLQTKAINLSQAISLSPTFTLSPTTLSSNCSISSPSLVAMLRQPPATVQEANHINLLNSSPSRPLPTTHLGTIIDTSVLSHPGAFHIKVEPVDSYIPEHSTIIMALPIKTEKKEQAIDNIENTSNRSPKSLIVDMNPD